MLAAASPNPARAASAAGEGPVLALPIPDAGGMLVAQVRYRGEGDAAPRSRAAGQVLALANGRRLPLKTQIVGVFERAGRGPSTDFIFVYRAANAGVGAGADGTAFVRYSRRGAARVSLTRVTLSGLLAGGAQPQLGPAACKALVASRPGFEVRTLAGNVNRAIDPSVPALDRVRNPFAGLKLQRLNEAFSVETLSWACGRGGAVPVVDVLDDAIRNGTDGKGGRIDGGAVDRGPGRGGVAGGADSPGTTTPGAPRPGGSTGGGSGGGSGGGGDDPGPPEMTEPPPTPPPPPSGDNTCYGAVLDCLVCRDPQKLESKASRKRADRRKRGTRSIRPRRSC